MRVWLVVAACLGLMTPCLQAQDGLKGAWPRTSLGSRLSLPPFEQTLAVADFDNDHNLDGAVLVDSGWSSDRNRYHIELHLSGSDNSDLTFQSTETDLAITALDINHDGKLDVVIEHSLSHKRLYVWLNDGQGRFHKGRVEDFPSAETASGKHAEAPNPSVACPEFCLPQQRGSETAMLSASSLRGRPPSTSESGLLSPALSLTSRTSAPRFSRAPPLSFYL